MPSRSPQIDDVSWGSVRVAGHETVFRDVKLFPGGARAWDWTETGTHHDPGIQPADVEEVLEHGPEVVILSQGFHERLQVMDATLERLEDAGVEVHVLPTGEAAERYNEISEKRPVGALIHSTC
jgi:hypothetical protein